MENPKAKVKAIEGLIDMLPEDIKEKKKDEIDEIKEILDKVGKKISRESNFIDK